MSTPHTAANSDARKRDAELLAAVPFKAADLIRCRVRLPFGPEKPCACIEGDCARDRPFTFAPDQPAEPDALAHRVATYVEEWGWHEQTDEHMAGYGHHMTQMLYRLPRDGQTRDMQLSIESMLRDLADCRDALAARLAEAEAERGSLVRLMLDANSRAEEANTALADLRAAVEAMHRPIKVYDECDHGDNHGCEPVEAYDYMGCSESVIGWGCAVCCYDDEYPREDCPHGADHRDVTREQSCPTRALVAQQHDGGAS